MFSSRKYWIRSPRRIGRVNNAMICSVDSKWRLSSISDQVGRFNELALFPYLNSQFGARQACHYPHARRNQKVGRQVGSYKLVREIGRGGMGAVYLAVRADREFRQRAAIKLVKRGMDTDFVIRRFRNERQILAALNHPNIARLLDGGTTTDGLPYFVMEYIEGMPIHRYCDTHRLAVAERLKLFRQVCAAVAYAHEQQVIHRDIKPGNILVTGDGTPKLLDFGIAKILDPDLAADTLNPTATAMRLMTPDYASPEQARGEQVTDATDQYSLGVLLYELLTGRRPHQLGRR